LCALQGHDFVQLSADDSFVASWISQHLVYGLGSYTSDDI